MQDGWTAKMYTAAVTMRLLNCRQLRCVWNTRHGPAVFNPLLSAPTILWRTQQVRFSVNLLQTSLKPAAYHVELRSSNASLDARSTVQGGPNKRSVEPSKVSASACGQQVPQPIISDWNSNRNVGPHCHDPSPS